MRHDHNYRNLFLGQVTFALAVMMAPFLVPFLIKEVRVDDSIIGVLLVLAAGTDLLVNIYWGHLGSRQGNRAVLIVASRIAAFAPIASLAVLFVPGAVVLGVDVRIAIVALALVTCRVAGSGIGVGRMNYLLDIAPQGMRASYIGFMNTFSVFSMLVPLIAGNVIDAVGYLPVFVPAAAFGIVSIAIIVRLDDVPKGLPFSNELTQVTTTHDQA
jgi:MFS family permease